MFFKFLSLSEGNSFTYESCAFRGWVLFVDSFALIMHYDNFNNTNSNNKNNFTVLPCTIFKTVWESFFFFVGNNENRKISYPTKTQLLVTAKERLTNLTLLIINKSFTTLQQCISEHGENHKNTRKVEGTQYPSNMSGCKPLFPNYSHNHPRELLAHFSLICPTT